MSKSFFKIDRYLSKAVIVIIRSYQNIISPWKHPCCRFYPTCSAYFLMVLREFSCFQAMVLCTKRLFKCHPWHAGGLDFPPSSSSPKEF